MTATIKQEHAVQLQVKLEFGHNASCRKRPTPEGFTHDWKVFVRGPENKDISHFVDKVVFHLHESFPKPKRVFKEPPYRIEEHGYGSFNLPIDVYFKTKEEPKKVRIDYDLFLPAVGLPAIDNIRSEALKFINPPEEFKRKVLKAGGEIVEATNGVHSSPLISSNVNGKNSHHNMSINNGKDMRLEEDKPLTTANEPEKIEKIKKIKPVNKPSTKSQSLAIKRPSNDEEGLHVKKKKKKLEESNTKATGFIPIEPPAAGVDEQDGILESKDGKFKVKALPSKMSSKKSDKATDRLIEKMKEKKKEKTQEVSGTTNISINNNNSGKRRNSSSSKNKEKSSKSPPQGKTKSSKAEERKFEKITFRRESGDSWSSSTSNSPGLYSSVLGTSMSGKNNPLGTLMAELSDQDDDDDEDIDISTPFQAEPSSQKSDSVSLTNNNLLDKKEDTKSMKSIKKKLKPTPAPKKQDSKNIPPPSVKKDVMKSPTNSVKTDPNKKTSKPSPKSKLKENRNGHQVPPIDLIHLHKELSSMKDSSCLQQVVDILSHTGYFVITDTTLDFDLYKLDLATIKQISSVLKDKTSTCTTR